MKLLLVFKGTIPNLAPSQSSLKGTCLMAQISIGSCSDLFRGLENLVERSQRAIGGPAQPCLVVLSFLKFLLLFCLVELELHLLQKPQVEQGFLMQGGAPLGHL